MRIREVSVRYKKSGLVLEQGESFRSSQQIYQAFSGQSLEPVEVFFVLLLDSKNRLFCVQEIARGCLTSCLVHPREVFFTAVQLRAAAIIAVHNHPSGDPQPSAEDAAMTSRLRQAGKILGISLLDHIVIGEHGYFSFSDHDQLL